MKKKNSLKALRNRLIALSLAGGMMVSFAGCNNEKKQNEDKEDEISINKEVNGLDHDYDEAAVRLCYGRFPKHIKVPSEYSYKYVLNMNGKKVLAAKLNEHVFSNELDLFDGKDAKTTNYFQKYNSMITIPDMFDIKDENAASHFFKCFIPEVSIKIYKGANGKYYREESLTYNLNKDNKNYKLLSLYGKSIILKTVEEITYNGNNAINATTIYKNQTGIGDYCQNVLDANIGSFECNFLNVRIFSILFLTIF